MIPEPEIWKEVREIALEALALRGDERSRFLADACKGDSGLRAAVEMYVSISTRQANAVERLRLGLDEDAPALPAGAVIDDFRIMRPIGRGGMGMVYAAIDEQNDRQVALKVLSTYARFNRGEHKLLAKLEDPFIARLYDSGETPEGFQYIVMEYVDGLQLADYCEKRMPSLRKRLVLFQKICEGVQAAHQKLIVHGDLSPKNILVTADGDPKVLDFGIARELGEEAAGAGAGGPNAMTPSFAAPEQRRGEKVLPTSDVYSLGVLLCGLVTGRHPLTLDDSLRPVEPEGKLPLPSRLPESVHPVILPPPPLRPPRLKRAIRGDLDQILLKALNPAPSGRYQTAAELGDEIGRFLGRLPINARRSTIGYRLSMLVRRRPWQVLVACLLVVMAVLLVGQYRRAVRGEREALAQVERTKHVNRFVVDLLKPANPYDPSSSSALSIEELLDHSWRSVEVSLDEYPDLKASLLSVLGEVLGARGEEEKGLELLEKALALQEKGPEDLSLAETLLRYGVLLTTQGEYADSDEALAKAEAVLSGSEEPTDPVLRARIRLAQAANRIRLNDYEAGRRRAEEALVYLRDSPASSAVLSTSFHALGRALESQGQDTEAEKLLELGLSHAERMPDARNPYTAGILNTLGTLRYKRADYAGAEELLSRALEMKGALFGEQSSEYGITLHNLAAVDAALGNYEEAEARFAEVVGILEEEVPAYHVSLLKAKDQWAAMLVRLRRFDEAEEILRGVVALEEQHLPSNDPMRAVSLNNLAYLYQEIGRFEEAEAAYLKGLGIFQALVGRNSRPVAAMLGNLGFISQSVGDMNSAERRYRESLKISQSISEGRTIEGVVAAVNLMSFYVSVGRVEEARGLAEEALSLATSVIGSEHWLTGSVHLVRARLLLAERDAPGAVVEARQARSILAATLPSGDWRLAVTDSVLGAALGETGETSEGEKLLLQSYSEMRRLKGDQAIATKEARERVRSFYEELGRGDEAALYEGEG